jgi:hypothetical protein
MDSQGINEKSVPRGLELRADTALAGLQTSLPASVTSLVVGGVTYTVPGYIAFLQSTEKPWKDSREAQSVIRQVSQTRPQDAQKLRGALADLKVTLQNILGRESEELTKFGFKPAKRAKTLTSEEKALKAAKAKLTRVKRGTLGKKQKAAIRQVETPTVTITPDGKVAIQAPSAPAPAVIQTPASSDQASGVQKSGT